MLAFRMGWHAVAIGMVLLIAAPNLLLMGLRMLWNSKMVASLEKELFGETKENAMAVRHPHCLAHMHATPEWQELSSSSRSNKTRECSEYEDEYYPSSLRWRKNVFFSKPIHPEHGGKTQIIMVGSSPQPQKQHIYKENSGNTIKMV
jgi:hypothetical protein